MENNKINYVGIIGCVVLYAVTSFASAFIGFLSPWCWIVLFPMLAAVLGAPTYLWVASRWQQFGVATVFALVLAAVLLPMGEIDYLQAILMVAAGVISDVVRHVLGNNQKTSVFIAYPILPLGIYYGHLPRNCYCLYRHPHCCSKNEIDRQTRLNRLQINIKSQGIFKLLWDFFLYICI